MTLQNYNIKIPLENRRLINNTVHVCQNTTLYPFKVTKIPIYVNGNWTVNPLPARITPTVWKIFPNLTINNETLHKNMTYLRVYNNSHEVLTIYRKTPLAKFKTNAIHIPTCKIKPPPTTPIQNTREASDTNKAPLTPNDKSTFKPRTRQRFNSPFQNRHDYIGNREDRDIFNDLPNTVDDKTQLKYDDFHICSDILTNQQQAKFRQFLWKNKDVFTTNLANLGKHEGDEMPIMLEDTKPVRLPYYRTTDKLQKIIDEHTDQLLRYGIIERSTSNYASPCCLVKKKEIDLFLSC